LQKKNELFIMSWYRKAKLADKSYELPSEAIFVRCMLCKRYMTDPEGVYREDEHSNFGRWKTYEELNDEEKKDFALAEGSTMDSPIGRSDGICPYCVTAYRENTQKEIEEYHKSKSGARSSV